MRIELLTLSVVIAVGCQAITVASTTTPATTPRVCQDGTFGPNCAPCGKCSPAPTACNKTTGACASCQAGYDFTADNKCIVPCSSGSYGTKCTQSCGACANGPVCDKTTGACPSGCQPGYNPSDRTCKAACPDHRYGARCAQSCGACANGDVCNKTTGACPSGCQPGYIPTDSTCKRECATDRWGQNCNRTCSAYCRVTSGRRCDKANGRCPCQPGYQTPLCINSCVDGRWGQDCAEGCSAQCTDVCNKVNGFCTCQLGYKPSRCTDICTNKKYGQNCSNSCGFCFEETCNHVTGNCSRCEDNRQLPLCNECIAGQWGPTCGQQCGHCGGDGSCHSLTGACVSPCQDGWTSATCDAKCPAGFFGKGCGWKCGNCRDKSPCRHDSGICELDCEDGYTGVLCKTKTESLVAPIVGSVLGAAVLISIVIVVALWFFMCRRSTRGPKTPQKDFITREESVSTPHEELDMRESQLYQNVAPEASGSISNYDRTNLNRQDSHAYAVHTPGKPEAEQDPASHTYQNTGASSSPGRSADKGRQQGHRRGVLVPGPSEGPYGNVPMPEATYGNVNSGARGVYGNIQP